MILDIWKALKNMRAEYSFESWFYVVIALLVIVFGLYSCTTIDEMVEMKVE